VIVQIQGAARGVNTADEPTMDVGGACRYNSDGPTREESVESIGAIIGPRDWETSLGSTDAESPFLSCALGLGGGLPGKRAIFAVSNHAPPRCGRAAPGGQDVLPGRMHAGQGLPTGLGLPINLRPKMFLVLVKGLPAPKTSSPMHCK